MDSIVLFSLLSRSGSGFRFPLMNSMPSRLLIALSSSPGIDFKIRTIELEDKKIKLQIWDTAGKWFEFGTSKFIWKIDR